MTDSEGVLVTGGTGFIGAYTTRELVENGHGVTLFDLSTDRTTLENVGVRDHVEIIRGDVTDPTDVLDAVERSGATTVIHLAAVLTDVVRDDPRRGLEVNVLGTNNVFETGRILDDQVDRVVWASSGAVYGPPDLYDGPVDETTPLRPATHYGAMKEYNESQARAYEDAYDLTTVGIRPQIVYGPYRETGEGAIFGQLIEKPALGEPFSIDYGDHLLDWNYVKDVAQAFRKATAVGADRLGQSVYNIGGEQLTIAESADVVRSILPDADIEVSHDGTLPWTQTIDISAARTDLDYDPDYDFAAGVRDYANALRREHGMPRV